ncbi:MAG: insulinase family protein [Candidatus Omnitrophica bacterium]|nr:insulinase family protein [Candidatus Omnitrophota bacterium]
MYKKSTLSNNLRVISNELKDRESAALGIWVGVGGRFEDDVNKGAAHFLEHTLFRGSLKYSCNDIKSMIEGVGGNLNAFTGEEQTCYYAKVPAKYFEETLDILSDMVFFPMIQKNDIERERTIILEEIKMYHDLPQHYVLELLDGLIWPDHPLGKNLAGTKETVGAMTQAGLRAYHQQYYTPDNIVVSACGNFSHEALVERLEEKLHNFQGKKTGICLPFQGEQKKAQVQFFRKPTEQMHVALGVPGLKTDHPDTYALALLNIILGGNMSSRLFDELREKRGLAYSIYSTTKTYDDTGLFMVKAGVDNAKLVDTVELIVKILRQIKRGGVKDEEFVRGREYFLGQFVLGLEDTLDHMMWVGESLIERNRIRTLGEVVYRVNGLTPDDIRRVASDLFKEKKFNLAVVGPVKEEQETALRKIMAVDDKKQDKSA